MPAIDVQAHSCEYCRFLVIDITAQDSDRDRRQRRGRDVDADYDDMSRDNAFFAFTLDDVGTADANGCLFCTCFLDDEIVSRETVLPHIPNNLPPDDPLLAIIEQQAEFLRIKDYRLIAHPYQGSGILLDIFRFEFFGLWNPATKKMTHRTKHGF
ncbi:hypothetical protein B0T26DRAFT_753495 [Lasiosphaeria miniovina]|uniref:Uncharacterized protein n=1 Tax=Lasiosphaeria miniovina TaxID=1954250 RepID=A0AA40ACJ2_9PEZI|nr:uncharacterized protein B0T26DRAFT_753495 [Lasiosphaeria miniovina]KAK0713382.1 hypothetical protein B0T26DRAFT_753495 [Lasiosphaeria miniovina]